MKGIGDKMNPSLIPLLFMRSLSRMDSSRRDSIGINQERYALFTSKTEEEALQSIRQAYSRVYERTYEMNFNEDGVLVKMAGSQADLFRKKRRLEEICDYNVSISRFKEECLIKIKLFDSYMTPSDEHIMLAKYLTEENKY